MCDDSKTAFLWRTLAYRLRYYVGGSLQDLYESAGGNLACCCSYSAVRALTCESSLIERKMNCELS